MLESIGIFRVPCVLSCFIATIIDVTQRTQLSTSVIKLWSAIILFDKVQNEAACVCVYIVRIMARIQMVFK